MSLMCRFARVFVVAMLWSALSSAHSTTGSSPNDAAEWQIQFCEIPDGSLLLSKVWRKGNAFYGAFDVRMVLVREEGNSVSFEGKQQKEGFLVSEPEASFEYLSLNGKWSELTKVPATYFFEKRDDFELKKGRLARIISVLPELQHADKALAWRLVVSGEGGRGCLMSLPFRAQQKRGPVTGFKADPPPSYWYDKGGPSPCNGPPQGDAKSIAPPTDVKLSSAKSESSNSERQMGCGHP